MVLTKKDEAEDSCCDSCGYKLNGKCYGGKEDKLRNDCNSITKGVKDGR